MSEQKVVVQSGTSLGTVVFLIFLVLKLTGHVDWSWFWVTFPLWGGLAVALGVVAVIAVVALLVAGVAAGIDWSVARRRRKVKR